MGRRFSYHYHHPQSHCPTSNAERTRTHLANSRNVFFLSSQASTALNSNTKNAYADVTQDSIATDVLERVRGRCDQTRF